MNFIEVITSWNDITAQICNVWKNAVLNKSSDAISEINRLLASAMDKMIANKDIDTKTFYRARIVSPQNYNDLVLTDENFLFSKETGIHGFRADKMGAPPKDTVNIEAGRVNEEGNSYLYLASDKATACSEVQPICDDLISVAEFKLTQSIKLVDLRNMPTYLQKFTDKDNEDKLIDMIFCSFLISLFSTPVGRCEKDIYKYSQYASNYFLKNCIQGILYNSSHNNNNDSYNLVIFDQSQAKCFSEYGEAIKCISVSSKFQSVTKNYRSNDDLEIFQASKETEPYLWNTAAMLHKNIGMMTGKKEGDKSET